MTKQQHLRTYDVILMYENTSAIEIQSESKNLPSDVHVVKYIDDESNIKLDAVRSYKMSDIFDAYYDYGIKTIQSIESGYGSIKPKLYNPEPKKETK